LPLVWRWSGLHSALAPDRLLIGFRSPAGHTEVSRRDRGLHCSRQVADV
jgi:hypothetical protein